MREMRQSGLGGRGSANAPPILIRTAFLLCSVVRIGRSGRGMRRCGTLQKTAPRMRFIQGAQNYLVCSVKNALALSTNSPGLLAKIGLSVSIAITPFQFAFLSSAIRPLRFALPWPI